MLYMQFWFLLMVLCILSNNEESRWMMWVFALCDLISVFLNLSSAVSQ